MSTSDFWQLHVTRDVIFCEVWGALLTDLGTNPSIRADHEQLYPARQSNTAHSYRSKMHDRDLELLPCPRNSSNSHNKLSPSHLPCEMPTVWIQIKKKPSRTLLGTTQPSSCCPFFACRFLNKWIITCLMKLVSTKAPCLGWVVLD